jgi:hypothetical protein
VILKNGLSIPIQKAEADFAVLTGIAQAIKKALSQTV